MKQNSEILIYKTEDNKIHIQTRLQDETVWLNRHQLAELFDRDIKTIGKHINNIFKEAELDKNSVVANFATTAEDGKIYQVEHYNLDVIISVGYRVKSHRGTQFRKWATERLKEYIVKGFTMNDELLKQAGGGNYFDELLQRIRDIRSSEKVFWRKVLDIYATSIDYDPSVEISVDFFRNIQNKMHWAAHGNTAAEIIYKRADSSALFMGLTSFKENEPTKQEVGIAKNYLNEKELNILNRIVTVYLEIAEIQAQNQQPMYMKDWLEKLDDFLKMTGKEILTHAGKISHKMAIDKAEREYDIYKEKKKNDLSRVEKDFIKQIETSVKELKDKGNI
ncbi:MAG: cell filamentation protein Fic [Candidatus Margulisiibacteriota bacterium]|nr:MAG: cell filamentation protein Fic [Candidatus Margulisiibacteriota bacterium]